MAEFNDEWSIVLFFPYVSHENILLERISLIGTGPLCCCRITCFIFLTYYFLVLRLDCSCMCHISRACYLWCLKILFRCRIRGTNEIDFLGFLCFHFNSPCYITSKQQNLNSNTSQSLRCSDDWWYYIACMWYFFWWKA